MIVQVLPLKNYHISKRPENFSKFDKILTFDNVLFLFFIKCSQVPQKHGTRFVF